MLRFKAETVTEHFMFGHCINNYFKICYVSTGWERTVHVPRCTALYSGCIFVLICREMSVLVFLND